MAYDPVERLREGNADFLFGITSYDKENLIRRIRLHSDRLEIIKGFISNLVDVLPYFCFEIVYDMEEYKTIVMKLMNKYNFLKFNDEKIKNVLYNTDYGENYIYDNLDNILSLNTNERIAIIIEFVYSKAKNKDKWVIRLSRNTNLHQRALFMFYIIKHYPEELLKIYDDLPKYMTNYTGFVGEQLTFTPILMDSKDISEITYACFESQLDRTIYLSLKEFLLSNYKENDLAEFMLENKKVQNSNESYCFRANTVGISEFKEDSDRLFNTSRNYQYVILHKYSEYVTKEIIDKFAYYPKLFKTPDDNWALPPLYKTFINGLGKNLKLYVDKYLELSSDKSVEFIGRGSTSHCFRLGDYVIKLINTKWSYEDTICPSKVFRIIKNLEEIYVRDDKGIVVAGLEIQNYLKNSAKELPRHYFAQLLNDLRSLGYYTTDTLMGGSCGDNCRILNSYKDADCHNPEYLPDYFKKVPLVLIDRDRVYSLNNRHPKQLRESWD